MKITVIGESRRIKKSFALLLIRRLVARWKEYGVSIERVPIRELPPGALTRRVPIEAKPSPYIPKELPPVELPGLKFTLPAGVPSQVVFLSKAARVFAENAAR